MKCDDCDEKITRCSECTDDFEEGQDIYCCGFEEHKCFGCGGVPSNVIGDDE